MDFTRGAIKLLGGFSPRPRRRKQRDFIGDEVKVIGGEEKKQ